MHHWSLLTPYAPLLALLVWAAIVDLRARVIRNWLTVSLAVCGLAQTFGALPTVSPLASLLGLLAGFGLLIVPFALGAIGGGDVKLLAAIGAWVGPVAILQIFLAESVIGMCIVLAQAVASGKLQALLRNSVVLVVDLAHASTLGVEHVERTGRHCRSIDRPLPYAVPTLAVTVAVILMSLSGGHG